MHAGMQACRQALNVSVDACFMSTAGLHAALSITAAVLAAKRRRSCASVFRAVQTYGKKVALVGGHGNPLQLVVALQGR